MAPPRTHRFRNSQARASCRPSAMLEGHAGGSRPVRLAVPTQSRSFTLAGRRGPQKRARLSVKTGPAAAQAFNLTGVRPRNTRLKAESRGKADLRRA